MNRLKFLLFALIVLGLWGYHLFRLSPSVAERAAELSSGRAAAVEPLIAQSLRDEASQKLVAIVSAVQTPALLQNLVPARPTKPEPLTAEKFTAVRDAVLAGLPEGSRADAVIVVVTEASSFASKGSGAPVTEGVDFAAAANAGVKGRAQSVMDGTYGFHSFPVTVLDRTEVNTLAMVAVGLPAKTPDISVVQKELGLDSVALVEGGKVIATSGSDAAREAVDTLKADEDGVTERGKLSTLGPLMLPAFTNNDPMGGKAPLAMGARRTVRGTPYEVISVASVRPALEPLANYQAFAVPAFALLLLLSLIWLALMGSGKARDSGKAMVVHDRPELAATVRAPAAPLPAAAVSGPEAKVDSAPLAIPDLPPAPEASPDDFEFPGSPSSSAPPVGDNNPPAEAATPGFSFDGEDNGQPTRAYSAIAGGGGAAEQRFGEAQHAAPPPEDPEEDFNPEATRVAMIPTELLQQSQREKEQPKTAPAGRAQTMQQAGGNRSGVASSGNPDEGHWNDIYKDFVATRERCGEPADGLTYDKFKVKLQKNREQLVQKYNCRTVKFQVYVKEGKAALKATPVKD